MKPKWVLARLALAATPFLSLLFWKPTLGGYLRLGLWFLATFIPFYVLRWPKVLDSNGDGIAGIWGLRATCLCYSSPPTPMFPSRGIVCVSNEGYETKICSYTTYILRPPKVEEELPRGGRRCRPGFRAGKKPLPPPLAPNNRDFRGRMDVVAVAWKDGEGASIYLRGNDTVKIPRLLRPPSTDNPYTQYRAYTDHLSSARDIAYMLLERAKQSSGEGEIRIGVDEYGGEYRLPLTHIGVFGSTGCGKSSTLALLAQRLTEKGLRVWIVDPYGEYSELEGFETLYSVPDPLEKKMPTEALQLLEDASILAFGLERGSYSPIVYQVLKQALQESRNIEDVVSKLRNQMTQADRWDVEQAIAAALRRLEPLAEVKWLGKKEIPDRAVFDVSALTGMAKILAVNSVLEKAWEHGNTVVLVDEAGNLARNTGRGDYVALPALKKVIMLGRSRNVYVMLADQYADRLPYALLGQLTKLWMRHNPPIPLSAPDDVRERLSRLRTGEAIIDGTLVKIDTPPRLGTKLSSILEKITLEELESFINGNASPEVKRKVWRLGLARGPKLTERGKQVYRIYRMLKKMHKAGEEAEE